MAGNRRKIINSLMLSAAVLTGAWGLPRLDVLPAALAAPFEKNEAPVDLAADHLMHDEENQTVTAIGNVELIQGEKILRADKVTYALQSDKVTAEGNVSLLQENGDVMFAEYVELTDEMQEGFGKSLLGLLADGSRFTAVEAVRSEGNVTEMTDASFTPCKICEENPKKKPLWQIRASKVKHDQEKQEVTYENARMEFFGVPIAYTPFFFHPDPTVDRRSGFLRPAAGWSTQLGANAQGAYYWNIAEDKDATFEVQATQDRGVVLGGQWRQRFKNAALKIEGSINKSDRIVTLGGVERIREGRLRGHLFADGLYNINNKWRAGMNINRSSDDQYLRLFDISGEDILENEIYTERFFGRNYSRISAQYYQDVRLGDRGDQPTILPVMEHTMLGEPRNMFGGRWMLHGSALGLARNDGQDVNRLSTAVGWARQFISRVGLKTEVDATARADVYHVQDRDLAVMNPGLDSKATEGRYFPRLNIMTSLPMVKNMETTQAVIEPIASITASPHIGNNDDSIPNEDSKDIQVDVTNLFEANRFPGVDRVEDGTHVAYGVKGSLYSHKGNSVSAFLGQSYRFDDDNLFPAGSGHEKQSSDYVGQVTVALDRRLNLDYRFQYDKDAFRAKRHEFMARSNFKRFGGSMRYLFAENVEGTGIGEDREQLRVGGYVNLTDNWRVNTSTLTDLGEEPGLRRAGFGVHYNDECFSFSVLGERNLTARASGENETTIMMRLGFKHLGEFSTPEILLQSAGAEE